MAFRLTLMVACLLGASAFVSEKNRPVTKVINMLKDMIEQLEKEGEEDEEVYEQMGCWCTTNEKEKTKQIADGEGRIDDLSHAIEDLSANSARLNTEIAMLNKEIAKNEEALESATALREKQLAEFTAEEKDMLTSLTSLKGAVVSLAKHHESSFLQSSQSEKESILMSAAVSIDHQLKKHHDLLSEVVTPHQRKIVAAFVQSQSIAPQSGAIFGILKAMKESFETNLAQSQKEESENVNAYEDLKKAKEEEIKAGKDQSDTKTQELAKTDEKNAQSKVDLEDTRNTLAANVAYLSNLKETCQNVDHEYEERSATRQLEIKATSEALAFLSSDEAHDLFTRSFNFVQAASASRSALRAKVMEVLSEAAKKSADARLQMLLVRTRGDTGSVAAFAKVKKTLQTMVDNLVQEKEDEIKKRDYCIEEFTENEDNTISKKRDKSDLEAALEDLKMNIKELTSQIEDLKAAIEEAQIQLKRAGVDREKQNQEFKVVVADQRATQKLIKVALTVLKGFYDKAALIQIHSHAGQPAGPPPPPGFKTYEKSASSGGVMGMMQSIIDDAKAMEEEAVRDEKDNQEAYEKFVQETNASIDAMNEDITNKSAAKSKAESDKVEREAELESVIEDINRLAAEDADLHSECDYTLKNFDIRQGTRDDEIESLKQAIAIFSGASFAAFLQH